MTDGWIEHDGKGMPVDGDTLVICKFRDGDEEKDGEEWAAKFWHSSDPALSNWVHIYGRNAEIVAYKVVKP